MKRLIVSAPRPGTYAPVVPVERPQIAETGGLGPCLGIGFYNPFENNGFLYHHNPIRRMPIEFYLQPVSELRERIDPAGYHVLIAGLMGAKIKGSFAAQLEVSLDRHLDELGFARRTKCLSDAHSATTVEIDTSSGYAAIIVLDHKAGKLSTNHRIEGCKQPIQTFPS